MSDKPSVVRVSRANWYGILQAIACAAEKGLRPYQIVRRVKIENEFMRDFHSFEEYEIMACVLVLEKLREAGLVKQERFALSPSKGA